MAERDPIDLIREQLNRTDGLTNFYADHEAFLQWQTETKTILEKAFSSRSLHYQSFLALRFREVSVKAFASPEIDKINAGRYKRDLESARNILQGAIKELTLDRTLFKKISTTPKTVEVALRGEYVVSPEALSSDMLHAIESALEGSGLKLLGRLQAGAKGTSFAERVSLIKRAKFGVYDLSGPDKTQVLLELGAALGLGKEAVLLCKEGSSLPEALRGVERIDYETASDIAEKLKKRVKP